MCQGGEKSFTCSVVLVSSAGSLWRDETMTLLENARNVRKLPCGLTSSANNAFVSPFVFSLYIQECLEALSSPHDDSLLAGLSDGAFAERLTIVLSGALEVGGMCPPREATRPRSPIANVQMTEGKAKSAHTLPPRPPPPFGRA